jgi:hypothetical protein
MLISMSISFRAAFVNELDLEPNIDRVVATVSGFSDRGLLIAEEPTVNHKTD